MAVAAQRLQIVRVKPVAGPLYRADMVALKSRPATALNALEAVALEDAQPQLAPRLCLVDAPSNATGHYSLNSKPCLSDTALNLRTSSASKSQPMASASNAV